MNIPQLITNRMEAQRLSGSALAAEMSAWGHPVTRAAVSYWVNGIWSPRRTVWPGLARVLRVELEAVALASADLLTEERLSELVVDHD